MSHSRWRSGGLVWCEFEEPEDRRPGEPEPADRSGRPVEPPERVNRSQMWLECRDAKTPCAHVNAPAFVVRAECIPVHHNGGAKQKRLLDASPVEQPLHFGNPADRSRGPVALRPWVTPGLPLSARASRSWLTSDQESPPILIPWRLCPLCTKSRHRRWTRHDTADAHTPHLTNPHGGRRGGPGRWNFVFGGSEPGASFRGQSRLFHSLAAHDRACWGVIRP